MMLNSIFHLSKKYYIILGILFLLILRLFRFEMVLFTTEDYSEQHYRKFISTHSKATDKILFYPGKNDIYLLTNRTPGSYYYFMLPWMLEQKGAKERVLSDILTKKVKIIIIDENIQNPSLTEYKIFHDFILYIEKSLHTKGNYNEIQDIKGIKIFLRTS